VIDFIGETALTDWAFFHLVVRQIAAGYLSWLLSVIVRQASENFPAQRVGPALVDSGQAKFRVSRNINYFSHQPFGDQVQTKQEHLQATTIVR
jgi:hypothetical protein